VKEKTSFENHPLIEFAIELAKKKLQEEINIYKKYKEKDTLSLKMDVERPTKPNLSLISRWLPREKSSFGWVFKKLAFEMFPQFLETAVTHKSKKKAKIKTYIELKKHLILLNAEIDTPQIKMCDQKGRWSELKFNNVTTQTLRRNRRAIMNLNKDNTERSNKFDRKKCAKNYEMHKAAAKADPSRHRIHGKRANVYEFVKDAMEIQRSETIANFDNTSTSINIRRSLDSQIDSINMQWESNKSNNKSLDNIPIISMVDTSGSMERDNNIPLYNAIGLGIRTSEITHPAFKHRVLTFSAIPQWVNLEEISDNFVKKAIKIRKSNWGMNTNFYRALKMILDTIIENEISPTEVEKMVLAIFSDMQIDPSWYNYNGYKETALSGIQTDPQYESKEDIMSTMFEQIELMYKEAGLRSKFNHPYKPPHILFWNLRKTNGFPSKSTQKNVTFMSGYSSVLLNNFCEKGMEALYDYTPETMLDNMLDNPRFRGLEVFALSKFA
jgi:hypothetical protein